MADYKKMYETLFNRVTDIIEELKEIQRTTEEMYIQGGEPKLTVLHPKEGSRGDPEEDRRNRKA